MGNHLTVSLLDDLDIHVKTVDFIRQANILRFCLVKILLNFFSLISMVEFCDKSGYYLVHHIMLYCLFGC